MTTRSVVSVLVFLAVSGAVSIVGAQEQADRGLERVEPSQEREPPEVIVPPLDRTPVLPPTDLPTEGLSAIGQIRVERIEFGGETILGAGGFASILAPYVGREVTLEELHDLRHELSRAYVERGYVNSGVVIPDQEVVDGVVRLTEIRGTLSGVEVSGNRRLSPGYITRRIEQRVDDPLRIDDLQQALRLLQEDPLIRRVHARLVPGLHPGEAKLDIEVTENDPLQVVLGADNHRTASTGGEQALLSVAHSNLTGHGDALMAYVGFTEGQENGAISYGVPLNSRGTRLQASYAKGDSKIIEEPFDAIDIESETDSTSLFLLHPWVRSPASRLSSSFGIETRHSESTLLGVPFSFSPGDRNGEADTTVLSAGLEWTRRSRRQAVSLQAVVRQGIDALDPTINDKGADGEFTALILQMQSAWRLGSRGTELLGRSIAQLAKDPLLGLEKLPVGGVNTVRGYRENRFVRDNGAAASLELRVPVLAGRRSEGRFHPLNLRIAPFVDYGRSWDENRQLATSDAVEIYSAGLGVLWNPLPGLNAEVYWGADLKDLGDSGTDLQDDGVHFSVRYRIPI